MTSIGSPSPCWSGSTPTRSSIAGSRRQVDAALGDGAELACVERWGTEPGFVDLLADRVGGTDGHVVFTAHSLPVEGAGDYEEQLLETSSAVAERAALGDGWSFSFQSESPTGVPWLGPDILDHLRTLHAGGVRHVRACPVGFVADHLEIKWDLDVEAAERCCAG